MDHSDNGSSNAASTGPTTTQLASAASDLEGQSCSSVWTDCNGCTSTGGYCGTPSGAQGEPGGHTAVVVCGEENCPPPPPPTGTAQCQTCATQFADAGGCAASDPTPFIPSGCGSCGGAAMQECSSRGTPFGATQMVPKGFT